MQFTKELGYSLWGAKTEVNSSSNKLLLLHGMGGSGALWRPIAASLEDRYQVLAVDQRGHGNSLIQTSEPVTYTPMDFGRDIVATLEKLSFHPTWIIGHSMGVRSACAVAHLKPQWVQGLILVDLGFSGAAGGGLGEGLADFLKILPSSFPNRAQAREFMAENCPDPAIAQYLLAVSVRGPAAAPAAGATTDIHERSLSFPFDHQALIQTVQAVRDFSVRPWVLSLAEAGMPMLILRGMNSLVWSHEEFESERAQFKDFASVVFKEVEGTGHGLPFEKRLEFVGLLQEFINSHQ